MKISNIHFLPYKLYNTLKIKEAGNKVPQFCQITHLSLPLADWTMPTERLAKHVSKIPFSKFRNNTGAYSWFLRSRSRGQMQHIPDKFSIPQILSVSKESQQQQNQQLKLVIHIGQAELNEKQVGSNCPLSSVTKKISSTICKIF